MIQSAGYQPSSQRIIKTLKTHRCILCGKCNAVGTNFVEVADLEKQGATKAVATKWWTCRGCEEQA